MGKLKIDASIFSPVFRAVVNTLFSKKDFLKLRPLTIMRFTDNQSCLTGECLKVEAVYQKPY